MNRLPVSWSLFRKRSVPEEAHVFRNQPPKQTILVERALDQEAARIENLLRKRYSRVQRKDTDQGSFLTGGRGYYSYFGVYLIHFSILIILAGAMIGFFFGFDAYVEIPEGGSIDTVQLKGRTGLKKLDFSVRCDRFSVDYYEDGTPKSYRSDLTFMRSDTVIHQGQVLVNHPAVVEGVRFYQSNFGSAPSGEVVIGIRKGYEKMQTITSRAGKAFDLPEKGGKAKILRMEEDFMNMGPAVKISIRSAKGEFQFWVFENIEQIRKANPGITEHISVLNPGLFPPYVFSLEMLQAKHYTGLQVTRDPGVPVVVAGALLLVLGFMTVFFYAQRQIWINLGRQGTSTRISIVGKTNKNPVGLDREIERLIGQIKKEEVSGS
jgi:cytochrome c biogenesis protein